MMSSSELRKAFISFQYAERLKSELILASKLVDEVEGMSDEDRLGAEKLLLSFLNALLGEVKIARNVTGVMLFEEVSARVEEAMEKVRLRRYDEALREVAQAISFATTCCQRAANELKVSGLI